MRAYWPWLGTTVIALIAIAISAPPVLTAWPRWVLLGVGALLLVGVLLSFPWPTSNGPRPVLGGGVKQVQRAGKNSKLVQGRDITINGGMGDQRP
ncbi:hypothetical protein OG921_10530 [Aldersonia sp. NBC_00410]|uniref:hypothetical protein n=1 Tax=Aldersonia sp. NBC_00410 TaxID=2975954 RepID=UPI00225B19EE|nr:hypothetical protein [Aldersonia sp. NBC_00410]MCX5043600.1 hypothetical protein [Aldersonia sp. NBC_00410]